MNKFNLKIVLSIVAVITAAAIAFWIFMDEDPNFSIKIILAGLATIVGMIAYIMILNRKRKDVDSGIPVEDEFSNAAALYAGQKAFMSSMSLWLLIFVFNSQFSSNEEMLGIGILGSALLYGIYLWYYKSKAGFDEK
jgi:hypothetical protein